MVALVSDQIRIEPRKFALSSIARYLSIPFFAVLVFALESYTASIPSALSEIHSTPPEEIGVIHMDDPAIDLHVHAPSAVEATIELTAVIDNPTNNSVVLESRNITPVIKIEFDDDRDSIVEKSEAEIVSNGSTTDLVLLEAGRLSLITVRAFMQMDMEISELLEQKYNQPFDTNDYVVLVGLELFVDGTTTEHVQSF